MISQVRPEPSPGITGAIRANSKKILAVIAVCVGGAVLYTAISPVYYGSEAKIFVRIGRESVSLDPTATTGQTVSVQDSRENELNSVMEVLTSKAILEGVVDELGPSVILGHDGERDPIAEMDGAKPTDESSKVHPTLLQKVNPLATYSRRDEAIQKLSKRLSVTNQKKSDVITISCEGQNPEIARKIVSKVIELARDAHTRVNRIAGSMDFFAEQTSDQQKQLGELETKLRDLKNQSGISSLVQQREIHLRQIGDLEQELQRTQRALQAANVQTSGLQVRLKKQPSTVVTSETVGMADTAAARMREQLYNLQIRENELSSRLTDDNPQLQQVRDQLSKAQQTLTDEKTPPQVTRGENRTYKDLEMSLVNSETSVESLSAQQKVLATQLADAQQALKKINNVEQQMASLEREIDVSRQKYRRYAENLEQARIDHELAAERISNINILQQPTMSMTPVRPRPLFNLSIGLGLGLVLSAGIVALSEQRRRERAALWQSSSYAAAGSGNGNGNGNGAASRVAGDFQPSGDPTARRIVYQQK